MGETGGAPDASWRPLRPTTVDHWLVEHRPRITAVAASVALVVVLVVAWLVVNGDGLPLVWWPVVAMVLVQVGVVEVVLRRAAYRVEGQGTDRCRRPGPP